MTEQSDNRRAVSAAAGIIAGTAAAYAATAWASLFLAVPPGFASPIWPAAGVALAAAAARGLQALPGVFLGSFIGNVLAVWPIPEGRGLAMLCGFLGLATGATVQALAGAQLLRWKLPRRPVPLSTGEVSRFIILVAILPCLISPTVGVASLVATGSMPLAAAGNSWLNWWIGDFTGALLAAPVLLMWLLPWPAELRHGRARTTAAALLLLVASITAFVIIRQLAAEMSPVAALVLVFGSGITAMAVFLLLITLGQTAAAEELVRERTAELRVAMEQARSADRLKSAFLATMSHELRTPLNSILGFTGIVLQGLSGPLTAEQQKQLGMVKNSARHLLALINDVLDISKIEAGEMTIALASFDLAASLRKVTDAMVPLAEKRGLRLSLTVADGVGLCIGDQRRCEQVVMNLLTNAVKFTEQGSIEVSCAAAGDAFSIAVRDTGIGIAADDIQKLFQPFHQLDSSSTRKAEGTGLGLSISRKLATLMGGTLAVASEAGKGSTFTFTLPQRGA